MVEETKKPKQVKEKIEKKPKTEVKPEEQLKEMTEIVEKQEKKKEDEVTEKAVKEMDYQERRRESREERFAREEKEKLDSWIPKTQLGKDVRSGKIKNIDEIFASGKKIMEPEIVDLLLNLKNDLLFIGQAKGKFGGGKRRAWRQTQKKTKEGNVPTFSVLAVVGDENGHFGIGYGRASETLPSREKAIRKAKLNIQKVIRGCASYDCSCDEEHSIPFATDGKCSSVRVKLMPAPQGTGIVAGRELRKILRAAGIKDIYSKTFGKTRTTINAAKACVDALTKLGDIELK